MNISSFFNIVFGWKEMEGRSGFFRPFLFGSLFKRREGEWREQNPFQSNFGFPPILGGFGEEGKCQSKHFH